MGNECSVCSCNDQKELDDATMLHFEKKDKSKRSNFNETE
jgi:hypothetical protein